MEEAQKITSRRVKFYIIPHVLEELNRIAGIGKGSKEARWIIKNLNRFEMIKFCCNYNVDEAIVKAAKSFGMAVATADVELKRKLREMKIPIITLKGRRLHLQPEDPEFWFI